MQLNTLKEALIAEVVDLFDAEQQILGKMSRISQTATNPALKSLLDKHVGETRYQVDRLKHVFDLLQRTPPSEKCEAMCGLLQEIEEIIAAPGDSQVKDAVLVGALQRIKHYELAGYRTAIAFAEQLGLDDVAETLEQTLDEETQGIKKLTRLAEGRLFRSGLNVQASQAGQSMM